MTALNKTASLWSKRLPALAREGRELVCSANEVRPACCFVFCNVCCWIGSSC